MVVSGGAFGSPTILERSGIGAKPILQAAGITPLVDLPGVGENYQGKFKHLSDSRYKCSDKSSVIDHNVVFVPYLADDKAETLDALFRGEKEEVDSALSLPNRLLYG